MLASLIRHLRHFIKPSIPYGLVRRFYNRGVDRRESFLRSCLPYGLVHALWPNAFPTYEDILPTFAVTARRLAEKMREGRGLRVVFLTTSSALFPARPLFDAMLSDAAFDPVVVVIPDLRWPGLSPLPEMEACRADLAGSIPEDRLSLAEMDENGEWRDVLVRADLVCYPLPYDASAYCYNPCGSVGRDFLPFCVNYGFYRSVYDRCVMAAPRYALMWKAFFECEATMAEYRAYSASGGANADLSGYIKMDRLALYEPLPHARMRILVALHHSVAGGTNRMLSLANFVRYAAFFLALPDRYPDIDFVFRPHPFLLRVMARRSQWGRARTERYVAALRAKRNVVWSDDGDYFRAFAESDACIQDCGSYLVEYFYTKKPCCYMLKSPGDIAAKFAPLGRRCLENCYIAYDEAAIDRFIQNVVRGGDDPKRTARQAFAETVMVNYPHAADVAREHIKADILRADRVGAILANRSCAGAGGVRMRIF